MIAALCASLALISCNKEPKDNKEDVVTLETPENVENAKKVVFTEELVLPNDTETAVSSIEFTETNRAIIVKKKLIAKADTENGTEVVVTTYTFSGGVYNVVGFGTVTISGGNVTVKTTGTSDSVTAPATVTSGTVSGNNDLFRAWKVANIAAKVDGPKVAIDMDWDHGNLDEIAAYIIRNGVDIPEEIKGYNVNEIQFTKNGTFVITFSGADAFYGSFNLSGQSFNYELEFGNSIINAKANGSLKVENGKAILSVNGKIENGNDTYTSTITITLKDAK